MADLVKWFNIKGGHGSGQTDNPTNPNQNMIGLLRVTDFLEYLLARIIFKYGILKI